MRFTLSVVIAGLMLPSLGADDKPAAKPLDPTLAMMATMIGGVWTNDNPDFRIEFRYDWAFNKSAVRGIGVTGKGSPQETPVEATFGFDPGKKTAYYLDFHGSQQIYKGTIRLESDDIVLEFETLVGPPAKWRSVARFPDKDTYEFTIFADKNGQWQPLHSAKLKRIKS
jgi:hypothetical protein